MKLPTALVAVTSLLIAVTASRAEPFKIDSTFTEAGKQSLKLPVTTVESGKEAVIRVAPWSFYVTATRHDGRSVKIETKIVKDGVDGTSKVVSRPTILTTLGKAATISNGDDKEGFSLEQIFTAAK
jgi:hypothetical protein